MSLLRAAFPSSTHADEAANALLGGPQTSFDIHSIELREAGDLVALAFAKRLKLRCDRKELSALSVGPVAVDPARHGRGLGRQLMARVDELAHSLGVEAIYLQGIPGFYQRFGYVPMLPKCKLRIELDSVADYPGKVNTRPALSSDIPALSAIYSQLTEGVSAVACRDDSHWNWLLGPASRSWYFQSPQIVELEGEPIGYFCVDRLMPERVRELAYRVDAGSILAFVFGLKAHLRARGVSHAELMTWRGSPIYQQTLFRLNTQFFELAPSSGGQIIKPLSPATTVRSVLSTRGSVSGGVPLVRSSGDAIEITLGAETVYVRLKSLMLWLFGVMSVESLISRGDISPGRGSTLPLSSAFSRILRSASTGAFVFQGDNL